MSFDAYPVTLLIEMSGNSMAYRWSKKSLFASLTMFLGNKFLESMKQEICFVTNPYSKPLSNISC
jgi:hypothetical protein